MKLSLNLFTCLFTACLLTACSFDGGSNVPSGDDPSGEVVCDTDRDCQKAGFDCNVYSCNEESRCEVRDTLCEDDQVCRVDGCEEAPAAECSEHYECEPEPGCEAAYCKEDGTCKSYSCGPSLECQTDDDCGPDHECNAGSCEVIPECDEDADCASDEYCSSAGLCVDEGGSTSGDLTIHCEATDGIRVTFSGDISTGIVTSEYGDLPGTPDIVTVAANEGVGGGAYWPHPTGGVSGSLPDCNIAVDNDGKWSCTSYLGMGNSVQGFNFLVVNSANSALRYFDLSKWDVTGYCDKSAQGGLCSCTSLPCDCQ